MTIEEISADKVGWLLKYIYNGGWYIGSTIPHLQFINTITDLCPIEATGFSPSSFAALCEAYELGDYFQVPLLMTGVVSRLFEEFSGVIIDLQNRKRPFNYLDDFFEGVARAYANNNASFGPLRHAFVSFVRYSRYLALYEDFTARLEDEPVFAKDILVTLAKEMNDENSRLGPPCIFPSKCGICDRLVKKPLYFTRTSQADGYRWGSGVCCSCYTDQ